MIYTLTLNPSLDYHISVDKLKMGSVNRSEGETLYPGGKGINVSLVLKQLGIVSTALGISAGFTGSAIAQLLAVQAIRTDFIECGGYSRINVKIQGEDTTELNGKGPKISASVEKELKKQLSRLGEGDFLVLGGSLAEGLSSHFYGDICEMLSPINCAVDTTGEALAYAITKKPYVIKPNLEELCDLLHRKIETREEMQKAMQELQSMGARNILLSLGAEGAMLLTEQGDCYYEEAPKGVLCNPVGSGDAMLAGYLSAVIKGKSQRDALHQAIAVGSANAFSEWIPSKETIEKYL